MQLVGQVNNVALNSPVIAGAEAVICQLGFVIPSRDGQTILLLGSMYGTINAQTSYSLNVRRGTLITSPLVAGTGVVNAAGAGGAIAAYHVMAVDLVTQFGPVQYCLTYLPVGGNTNLANVSLSALLL